MGGRAASPEVACLDEVRKSDLVILLLGPWYGSRTADGKSPTHLEYEAALDEGKPVLVYIKRTAREADQQAFVAEAQDWAAGECCQEYDTPEDLGPLVQADVRRLLDEAVDDRAFERVFPRYIPRYLGSIVKQHEAAQEENIPYLPLSASVAPLAAGRGVPETAASVDVQELIGQTRASGGVLLLRGDAGSGKTYSLRMAVYEAAREALALPPERRRNPMLPVPVLVSLANYQRVPDVQPHEEILSLVARALRQHGFPPVLTLDKARRFLTTQRFCFCFDGLNEIAEGDLRYAVTALRDFVARHPNEGMVFTARSHFLARRRDLWERTLGGQCATLDDLALHQLRDYLASGFLDEEAVQQIGDKLSDPDTFTLAQKPLFLFVLIKTITRLGEARVTKGSLLGQFVDMALAMDLREKASYVNQLSTDLKLQVISTLGYQAHEAGTHTFGLAALRSLLQAAVPTTDPDSDARVMAEELVENGILAQVGGSLRFWHPALQEYCAALEIRRLAIEPLLAAGSRGPHGLRHRLTQQIMYWCRGRGWEEPMSLAFGFIEDEAVANDLLERIRETNTVLAGKCIGNSGVVREQVVRSFTEELQREFALARVDWILLAYYCLAVGGGVVLAVFPSKQTEVVSAVLGWLVTHVGSLAFIPSRLQFVSVFVMAAVCAELLRLAVNRHMISAVVLPSLVALVEARQPLANEALRRMRQLAATSPWPANERATAALNLFCYRSHQGEAETLAALEDDTERILVLAALKDTPYLSVISAVCSRLADLTDQECRVAVSSLLGLKPLPSAESLREALPAVMDRTARFGYVTRKRAAALATAVGLPHQPPRRSVHDLGMALRNTPPIMALALFVVALWLVGAGLAALREALDGVLVPFLHHVLRG